MEEDKLDEYIAFIQALGWDDLSHTLLKKHSKYHSQFFQDRYIN